MEPQGTTPNSTERDTRRDARSPKLTASKCTRRHDSVRSDDIIVRHLESRKTKRGVTQEPSGGQTEIHDGKSNERRAMTALTIVLCTVTDDKRNTAQRNSGEMGYGPTH